MVSPGISVGNQTNTFEFDYELDKYLGDGKNGDVYLCKNRKSQILCAMKKIKIDDSKV